MLDIRLPDAWFKASRGTGRALRDTPEPRRSAIAAAGIDAWNAVCDALVKDDDSEEDKDLAGVLGRGVYWQTVNRLLSEGSERRRLKDMVIRVVRLQRLNAERARP